MLSSNTPLLRAIETQYRGYRFRSRTEARYGVLFDAAGIAWQYEPERFNLNGVRYLPDFYLPELRIYVEVKPTKEAAERAAPLMWALMQASGCGGLFAIGSPTVEPPDNFFTCSERGFGDDGFNLLQVHIRQCPFCTGISFGYATDCHCTGDIRVLQKPWCERLRLTHALGEAQRARFEFGENGKPRPYSRMPATSTLRVYAAGAIFCDNPFDDDDEAIKLEPWRADIFDCETYELTNDAQPATGRFVYAGPTVVDRHGSVCEDLAQNCLREVASADVLFVWIDRKNTIGTLVEIGAAYATRKPILVAFADEALAELFYFAEQLATVAVIAADVKAAWQLFTRWQANN